VVRPVPQPPARVCRLSEPARQGASAGGNRSRAVPPVHADRLAEFTTTEKIGRALVAAGLLTKYQVERVLAGAAHGLVLGNYRVLDRLGDGSVGVVFLAEHVLLKRKVAVKVLPTDKDFPQSVLDRFYGEMRVLAQLNHPHIVAAYDAGVVPSPDAKQQTLHYLVMELLETDLEQYVYDHGTVPLPQACEWMRQAAAGLQQAHDHHLIHRDLKPSNLLLDANRQIRIVDFGLAREFQSNRTSRGRCSGASSSCRRSKASTRRWCGWRRTSTAWERRCSGWSRGTRRTARAERGRRPAPPANRGAAAAARRDAERADGPGRAHGPDAGPEPGPAAGVGPRGDAGAGQFASAESAFTNLDALDSHVVLPSGTRSGPRLGTS